MKPRFPSPTLSSNTEEKSYPPEIDQLIIQIITHDINNLIASIHAISELQQTTISNSESINNSLEKIKELSINCSSLTNKLKNFLNPKAVKNCYINIESLIKEELPLIQSVLKEKCKVMAFFENKEVPIYANPILIIKNFLFLIVKIKDTLKCKSSFKIRTRSFDEKHYSLSLICEIEKDKNWIEALQEFASDVNYSITDDLLEISIHLPISQFKESFTL